MFYGMHLFGMSRTDVLNMPYGEMLDLIACYGVFNGAFKEKPKKKVWRYEDAVKLR